MIEIREVRNDTWTTETDPITTRNEPNGAIENTLRDPSKHGPPDVGPGNVGPNAPRPIPRPWP